MHPSIKSLRPRTRVGPLGSDWLVAIAWCSILLAGVVRAEEGPADSEPQAAAPTAEETAQPDSASLTELSVAPMAFPAYPDDRPEWVDQPPRLDGTAHSWPIVSVPSWDRARCQESLHEQARLAIAAYASDLLEQETGHRHVGALRVKNAWVDARLNDAKLTYHGTVGTSDGDMFEEAALLHFDASFRKVLRDEWRNQQVAQRLTGLGVLSGGSMAMLVAVSAMLRWVGLRKQ